MAESAVSSHLCSTDRGPIVEACGLSVLYGARAALRDVSFRIGRGELLGVVGASGSGKTSLGRALLNLLPDAQIHAHSCRVCDVEVVSAGELQLRRLRGGAVGLILQDPLSSLDPLQRVGDALVECIAAHQGGTGADARVLAARLLAEVEMPEASAMARRYPHELSGGQRQRVGIALALANDPQLVIADEPTSSLDPPLARQIAGLLRRRCADRGAALMLISHDLMLISAICDRVVVLHEGQVVEVGPVSTVVQTPVSPATIALLQAAGLGTDAAPGGPGSAEAG